MKKLIFPLLTGLVLITAGCSSDEIIDAPKEQAIAFENTYINKLGRATDLAIGTDMHTKLWGATSKGYVFNEQAITVQANNNVTYTPPKYWAENTDYHFMAIAANVETSHWSFTVPTSTSDISDMYGTLLFNNDAADATTPGAAGLEDIGVAYASASTKGKTIESMGKVALTFKHVLTRLRFTFKNSIGTGNYLKISNVTISKLPKSGSLAFAGKTFDNTTDWNWILDNETGTSNLATTSMNIPFTNSNSKEFGHGATITTETLFSLPFATEFLVEFDVDLYVNNGTVTDPDLVQMTQTPYHHKIAITKPFEMGRAYVFNAEIGVNNINPDGSLKPIEFTGSVEPWNTDDSNSTDIKIEDLEQTN